MNEDDLSFVLSVNPDMKPLQEAVKDVGTRLDEISAKTTDKLRAGFRNSVEELVKTETLLSLGSKHITEMVKVENALASAQERYARALDHERLVQSTLGGRAGLAVGAATGAAVGAGQYAGGVASGSLRGALSEMNNTLGPLSVGLKGAEAGAKEMSKLMYLIPIAGVALGPMSDALAGLPGLIGDVTSSLISFAAKASPATFELFSRAVDNAQAAIGHAFVPVLEVATRIIREMGDGLATVLPTAQELRQTLASSGFLDFLNDSLREFREAITENGAALKDLASSGFLTLAYSLTVVARATSDVTSKFSKLWAFLTFMNRDELARQLEHRSSFGMAASPAHFSGFMDYQRQLQQSAYSAGATMADVPDDVATIRSLSQRISDGIETLGNWWRGTSWGDQIRYAFIAAFRGSAAAAAAAAQDAANASAATPPNTPPGAAVPGG